MYPREKHSWTTVFSFSCIAGWIVLPAILGGCLQQTEILKARPSVVQPAENAEKPYAQFPKLSAHCDTCKQCAGPLMSETGEEQSLCEAGFRLLQEDLLDACKKPVEAKDN